MSAPAHSATLVVAMLDETVAYLESGDPDQLRMIYSLPEPEVRPALGIALGMLVNSFVARLQERDGGERSPSQMWALVRPQILDEIEADG